MSLTLISSPRFAEHLTPPGHPESPARAEAMELVAENWRARGGALAAPRPATGPELERVHDADYLDVVAATSGQAVAFDADTYTSAASYDIALLAAGAVTGAVDRVMNGAGQRVLALVRPPGHHAERNRAMGFCLFNNVAIGAAHARAGGARRVAIVDYDVHHGNGTQHIFEEDPSILYISTHQHPHYPGTGAAAEIGSAAGRGFTVNLPLQSGAVDQDYALVFSEVVVPVLRQFSPDLLMVSAGFDAHERDPLAAMRLTTPAFAAMTMELARVADECCSGRLVAATEGGYDLEAVIESLQGVVDALACEAPSEGVWPATGATAPRRGRAAVEQAKALLGPYWNL